MSTYKSLYICNSVCKNTFEFEILFLKLFLQFLTLNFLESGSVFRGVDRIVKGNLQPLESDNQYVIGGDMANLKTSQCSMFWTKTVLVFWDVDQKTCLLSWGRGPNPSPPARDKPDPLHLGRGLLTFLKVVTSFEASKSLQSKSEVISGRVKRKSQGLLRLWTN